MSKAVLGIPRPVSRAFLLIFSVVAIAAAGCGDTSDEGSDREGGSTESASKDSPILIGAPMAKTGYLVPYDKPFLQGAQFAVDDFNAEDGIDGRQIKLKIVNSSSEVNGTARAAEQLLDGGADFLFSSCNYEEATPANRAGNTAEVVVMGCNGDPKGSRVVGDVNSYVFDISSAQPAMAANMADFAYEQGWRTGFFLRDTADDYATNISDFAKYSWDSLDGTENLGTETFVNTDASIASQITKIKALPAQPDVIFLGSYIPGGVTAVRQLRSAGIDSPVVASDAFDGPAVTKTIPNLSDFYYTTSASIYGDDPDDRVNDLVAQYTDKYGPPESFLMVWGYSAVQALKAATEEAGTTDGTPVRDVLQGFDKENFLVGPTSFSETAHIDPARPQRIIQIQNGEHSYKTTPEPPAAESLADPFG